MNIKPNLGIKIQHEFLNTTDNSQDPIENAICKYENHPSIVLIKKIMQCANSSFVFETVTKEKIEKLITNLSIRKVIQSNDIPTKLVKEFGYLFSKYIATSIKRLKFHQSIKKTEEQKNRVTDLLAFCQMFPKFMKDVYASKGIPILTKYSLKINAVFVKALILNISF